jgi:hypothetical protein
MRNRAASEGGTDLADVETGRYKVDGGDEYVIGTREHPRAAM